MRCVTNTSRNRPYLPLPDANRSLGRYRISQICCLTAQNLNLYMQFYIVLNSQCIVTLEQSNCFCVLCLEHNKTRIVKTGQLIEEFMRRDNSNILNVSMFQFH